MQPQTMFWQKPAFKPLAVIILGVVLLALVSYVLYLQLAFRVVGTNPTTNNVATVTPFLKVSFNKPLTDTNLSVSGTSGLIKSYSVSGKTMTVLLNHPMQLKKSYLVDIEHIQSTSGKIIRNKSISFTTKAIDTDNLPKDQQETLLNQQDKTQGVAADPIISHLPYGTLDFSLSALLTTGADNKTALVLQAKLLLSNADMSNEDAAVAQYKQEVLDYIKSLGLNPANYTINYIISGGDASAAPTSPGSGD